MANWKRGYKRIATVLSIVWVPTMVAVWIDDTHGSLSQSGEYLMGMLAGLVFLWVVVPFLVYVVKWVIKGFTDKPEDQ